MAFGMQKDIFNDLVILNRLSALWVGRLDIIDVSKLRNGRIKSHIVHEFISIFHIDDKSNGPIATISLNKSKGDLHSLPLSFINVDHCILIFFNGVKFIRIPKMIKLEFQGLANGGQSLSFHFGRNGIGMGNHVLWLLRAQEVNQISVITWVIGFETEKGLKLVKLLDQLNLPFQELFRLIGFFDD